ncbi:MAG TPA: hypothetical protein VM096_11530 [Vicinamibacterales bacterium]|nr:hypothetical protein [Vicinamibacterales bacterium]
MEPGTTARVWKDGRLQEADRHDAALSSLCQAVEKAMRQHPNAGVKAVILMVEQPRADAEPAVAPVPVYVDVLESGLNQDSGYGYGV